MPAKPHPLSRITMTDQKNWPEWKKEWEQPQSYGRRISLIRELFEIRDGVEAGIQKVVFALEMADGHARIENFLSDKDKDARWVRTGWKSSLQTPAAIRENLSQHFGLALCEHVFIGCTEKSHLGFVSAHTEPLFSKLLWFFRQDDPYINSPCNFSESRLIRPEHIKQMRKFAVDFADKAWNWAERTQYWDISKKTLAEAEATTDKHWKEVLDLLFCLGKTNLIYDKLCHDDKAFDRVRGLVLKTAFQTREGQFYPKGIAEAVRHNIPFAKQLMLAAAQRGII